MEPQRARRGMEEDMATTEKTEGEENGDQAGGTLFLMDM